MNIVFIKKNTFYLCTILVSILSSLVNLVAQDNSTRDAFLMKQNAKLFDQRGYGSGATVSVDGKLQVSNSNGNVTYSYPISNRTIQGFPMTTTLNYCGSIGFTAFGDYVALSDLNIYSNDPLPTFSYQVAEDRWDMFHQTRAGWILGFNGFAVQLIGQNGMYCINPKNVRPNENTAAFTEYDDNNFNWAIEGYDFCNRMYYIYSNDAQDVIKILRSDGSLLELRNGDTPSKLIGTPPEQQPKLYTGHYYENAPNSKGFGIVEYNDEYLQPYQQAEFNSFGFNKCAPYRPRKLHYFPGDGLEYVFVEWIAPYGREHYTYSGGRSNGIWTTQDMSSSSFDVAVSSFLRATRFGGISASPSIFYLEEVKDGAVSLTSFKRARHVPLSQSGIQGADSTKGRAPLTGFDGHTLTYYPNSLTIEALGRTVTIKYDSVIKEGYRPSNEAPGIPWSDYGNTATARQIAGKGVFDQSQYRSFLGMVTSIIDPEQRSTGFEYENYVRTYTHFRFPKNETDSAHPIKLRNNRLIGVTDPSSRFSVHYTSPLSKTFNFNADAGASSPFAQINTINIVDQVKKYSLDNYLLTTTNYTFPYNGGDEAGDLKGILNTEQVYDNVTGLETISTYTFEKRDILAYIPNNAAGFRSPDLQYTYLKESKVTGGGLTTTTRDTQVVTNGSTISTGSKFIYVPRIREVLVTNNGTNTTLRKSYQKFGYSFETVRTYDGNTALSAIVGKEISTDTTFVYNPDNITSAPLFTKVNKYLHLPFASQSISMIDTVWLYYESLKNYLRLRGVDPEVQNKSWSQVLCKPQVQAYRYDTLSQVLAPPHFGLPHTSMVWDNGGNLMQGKSTKYQEDFLSGGKLTYNRGLTLSDTIIGRNGTRRILGGLYDYSKWSRRGGGLLSVGYSANGGKKEVFYNYNQPINYVVESGEFCTGYHFPQAWKLDNINSVNLVALDGGGMSSYFYESSSAEQSKVRKYKRTGDAITLDSVKIVQVYERGFFGQAISTVDPNGWYSRYSYDNNGRLDLLQLPGDFASANSSYVLETVHSIETILSSGCTSLTYFTDEVICNKINGVAYRTTTPHVAFYNFPMKDCSRLYAAYEYPDYRPCPCGDPAGGGGDATQVNHDKSEKVLNQDDGNPCNPIFSSRSEERYFADIPFGIEKLKESGIVIDSIVTSFHITSIVGSYVNLRLSFPQMDTAINYVLTPSDNPSTSTKRQYLRINLTSLKPHLFSLAGMDSVLRIKIAVLTQGARVDFANDADDSKPRLLLYGRFKDTYGRSDYTIKYAYDDDGTPSATASYKTDDRQHSANSWNEDYYSRTWNSTNEFGADYRVKKSTSRIGTPLSYRNDEVTSAYTGLGQPISVTDQEGFTVNTSYDALGRVNTVTNADNTLTQMKYDVGTPSAFSISSSDYYGYCSMKKSIDEKGLEVRQYYDAFDRLRKEIIDSGATGHLNLITLYDYDIQGRLKKVTNPKAQVTDYWYDDFGRVKYKRQPDMGILSYSYDNVGNTRFSQTQEQSSKNKFTYFEYDDMNRVSVVGEALVTRTAAADTGIVTSDTLNLHRWTDEIDPTILHDGGQSGLLTTNKTLWNNLAAGIAVPIVTQPPYTPVFSECVANEPYYPETFGPTLPTLKQGVYGFSPNVLPTTIANFEDIALHPEFVRLVIHYDELPTRAGAVWGNFTPLNRSGIWDSLAPKGKVRNLRGQQAAVAYRDKASDAFHYQVYSYDERGRVEALLRFTENLGYDAVYYTYNSANQVVEQRVADAWRQTVTWYGYDWNSRIDTVSTQIYPNGTGLYHSMVTSLDSLKRPIFYTKPNTGVARIVYSYTKRGMVDNMLTLQPGLKTSYTYNSRGFLDSLECIRGLNTVFTEGLEYDVDGQITAQHYRQGAYPVATLNYDYDHRKQLTSWGNTDGHTDYEYDAVGNRKSTKVYDGSNTLQSTDAYINHFGTNRLALRNLAENRSITYSYYADGAMKRSVYKTYTGQIWENKVENFGYSYNGLLTTYNIENMYSSNVNCFDEGGPFKWEWSYRYSPGGERESKRLTTSPMGDGVSSHNWNYYLLGGNKQQLAVYNGRETSRSDCYSNGNRVDFFASEYLTYGNSGTPLITTRPTGVREFAVLDHLGSVRAVVNGSGTVINTTDYEPFGKPLAGLPFREGFIGKENDYESNLADHGVRKYDYDAGIFRSIDPLWEKYQGWSPYQYSANNPLKIIDPSGMAGTEPYHGDDNRAKDTRPQTKEDFVQDKILRGVGLSTNRSEREWMKNNPWKAVIVADNMILAKGFVQNKNNQKAMEMNPRKEHNTVVDGVRHVVWSALNATTLGEPIARDVADLHENFISNPIGEEAMDRHNNEVGFQIADMIKKSGIHQDNPFFMPTLTKAVIDAYRAGRIQIQPQK